ncbi:hypothetical protein JB92DRAFT_3048109 [Gautieria morchelliformis]|nr:hypothetical protein JB92DRAFT_3048109 [Gautieria morchelliformis]
MSSDAALLQEIQRLSGAIDRHKLNESKPHYAPRFHQSRSYVNSAIANRKYVNPAISHKKYVNPAIIADKASPLSGSASVGSSSQHLPMSATRELVIDGVAFESSSSKLTRKDLIPQRNEPAGLASAPANSSTTHTMSRYRGSYVRKGGSLVPSGRVHKPKYSKGKRLGGCNNMVLDNIKGTRTGRLSKRRKIDKQCRFFTLTGVCQRGLTCPYHHDPEKVAICPLFLSDSCPNSADTCHLSHDPTPSRVPFCHHFANHGRCTRERCPYPHVRVGPRNGVCRDFAVVGYCDMGIECDKQHVRECPDFAEKGICPNRGCKLPHVIRAYRRRQPATSTFQNQGQDQTQTQAQTQTQDEANSSSVKPQPSATDEYISPSLTVGHSVVSAATENAGVAEDYISLTFEESDDDDGDEDDEDDDAEDISEDDQDAEGLHEEKER